MKIITSGVVSRGIGGTGCCWPSVARLADGRLAAVFSGGRRNHVCPFGRVDIACSRDEGRRWSPGAPVLDTPLDERDAGIVVWNRKIVLTTFNNSVAFQRESLKKWLHDWTEGERAFLSAYLQTVSAETEAANLGSLIAFSDDGEGFEGFAKLPVSAPHGPLPLKDGRLLYIGKAFSAAQTWEDTPLGGGLYAMWTADGKSWSPPAPLPLPENAALYEPHAVECEDGRILTAARAHTQDGRLTVMLADSFDGGRSFTPFRATGISGSPPHLLRLSDGRIAMAYGRREKPFGIRARLSGDCGASWSGEFTLRDDGLDWDLGYPCSAELRDGSILTVYYIKTPGNKLPEIQYTVWSA